MARLLSYGDSSEREIVAKSRTIKSNLVRVFEEARQPFYVLDAQRKVIFCNQAMADWLDCSIEEITGWQCQYSSGDQILANRICPPPEAFSGRSSRFLISLPVQTRSGEFWEADCWMLAQTDQPSCVAVMVAEQTLELPLNSTAGRDQVDSQNSLGDLLKLVRHSLGSAAGLDPLLGQSDSVVLARRQIELAAAANADLLMVGPLGAGRRKLIEYVHYSQNEAAPLIPIEASFCDPEIIQQTIRELFVEPGKDPTAEPVGDQSQPTAGRILLLNAENLSKPTQVELRGFFQLSNFQFSLSATAGQSLIELADEGEFDRELAFQLSTFVVNLKPLSERAVDIPLLVQSRLEEFNARGGRQLNDANKAAMRLLTEYHWPGEYMELCELIGSACEQATGPNLVKADLPKRLLQAEAARQIGEAAVQEIDLNQFLSEIETELIRRAVSQCKGNKTQAAKLLNISRASLLRRWDQIESQ